MSKKRSQQSNWRLSEEALKLLDDVAKQTGMSKTSVVETCIAKHAMEVPELETEAKTALVKSLFGKVRAGRRKSFSIPDYQFGGMVAA